MPKDYYSLKARASELIDNMIIEGKTDAAIYFKIGKVYGFGKKLIADRREAIESLIIESNKEKENKPKEAVENETQV